MFIRSIPCSPVTSDIVHHVPNSMEVQGIGVPVIVTPHGSFIPTHIVIPNDYYIYIEGVQYFYGLVVYIRITDISAFGSWTQYNHFENL